MRWYALRRYSSGWHWIIFRFFQLNFHYCAAVRGCLCSAASCKRDTTWNRDGQESKVPCFLFVWVENGKGVCWNQDKISKCWKKKTVKQTACQLVCFCRNWRHNLAIVIFFSLILGAWFQLRGCLHLHRRGWKIFGCSACWTTELKANLGAYLL